MDCRASPPAVPVAWRKRRPPRVGGYGYTERATIRDRWLREGQAVEAVYASPPAPAVAVPEEHVMVPLEIYEALTKGRSLTAEEFDASTYPLAAVPQPPASRSYEEGKRDGIEAAARVAEGAIDTVAHDDRLETADLVAIRERDQKIATAIRSLANG